MIINQFVDRDLPFLIEGQSVQEAQDIIEYSGFSQLPIVGSGHYLGLIAKDDIRLVNGGTEIPLELRQHKSIYVNSRENILEVLRLGNHNQIEIMPVVETNLKYLGSVKMESCYEYLIKSTSLGELGGILVLKVKKNDYSIAEISRIIEMEGTSILHFFLNDYDETTKELKITIKVDGLNVESLERTFERYGYFVDAIFSEKEGVNGLKERYDSLMAYLNV